MIFTMDDETELRDHLRQTVISVGEVLVCDEKLWFYSGEADGWVRLVISKPDRVGHWFYLAVVKLANGKFYSVYYRLHRLPNKLANQQGTLSVDIIGADWIQIFRQSDPEITEPFIIADGYYMSEAMRDKIKAENVAAIIAVPPERWQSMISLLEPKLKSAGDSSALYNEETDEVQIFQFPFNEIAFNSQFSSYLVTSHMTLLSTASTRGRLDKWSKFSRMVGELPKDGRLQRPGISTKRLSMGVMYSTRTCGNFDGPISTELTTA
jgi:hypothetical protein